MLGKHKAIAKIAVEDLDVAAALYEGQLELDEVSKVGEEVISYRCGNSVFNIYRSSFAGANKATAVTWAVDNIKKVISTLRSKGMFFGHYDIRGLWHQGDLHIGDKMKTTLTYTSDAKNCRATPPALPGFS